MSGSELRQLLQGHHDNCHNDHCNHKILPFHLRPAHLAFVEEFATVVHHIGDVGEQIDRLTGAPVTGLLYSCTTATRTQRITKPSSVD